MEVTVLFKSSSKLDSTAFGSGVSRLKFLLFTPDPFHLRSTASLQANACTVSATSACGMLQSGLLLSASNLFHSGISTSCRSAAHLELLLFVPGLSYTGLLLLFRAPGRCGAPLLASSRAYFGSPTLTPDFALVNLSLFSKNLT